MKAVMGTLGVVVAVLAAVFGLLGRLGAVAGGVMRGARAVLGTPRSIGAVVGAGAVLLAVAGRVMQGGYGRPVGERGFSAPAGQSSYGLDGDTPTPIQGQGRGMPSLRGIPTPSDTYRPTDQGTDWPPDAFTALVMGHQSPEPIVRPALNSYAGDGNMEALDVYGPFSHQETGDVANYTGGVGPGGRSTPEAHPEPTAPDGTLNMLGAGGGLGPMPTAVS